MAILQLIKEFLHLTVNRNHSLYSGPQNCEMALPTLLTEDMCTVSTVLNLFRTVPFDISRKLVCRVHS